MIKQSDAETVIEKFKKEAVYFSIYINQKSTKAKL